MPLLSAATEGYFALLTTNLETLLVFFCLALKHGLGSSVRDIAEKYMINTYFSSEGFKKYYQEGNNDHTHWEMDKIKYQTKKPPELTIWN